MADNRPTRQYNCSDSALITGGLVLVNNFINHKASFLEVRTDYADPFGANLKIRIENASDTFLGETRNQGPLASTADLVAARGTAKEKVKLMRDSLISRFGSEEAKKKKYLSDFGLDLHYTKFYAGDDESASELYQKLKSGLTPAVKTELGAAGLAAGLFDGALAALAPITDLNVSQQGEKGEGKVLTDAGIEEFNSLYTVYKGIMKQAQGLFAKQPAILDKFVWDKIVKGL